MLRERAPGRLTLRRRGFCERPPLFPATPRTAMPDRPSSTPPSEPHASAPPDLRPGLVALDRGDLVTAAECARACLASGECYDARW